MFKQLMTLVRGCSADSANAFLDANALPLLRQQIREAAACVEKSRKALAMVIAYSEREKVSLTRIEEKIADLELRATAALDNDQLELATEAAETIAHLDAERNAAQHTIKTYSTEIARMREGLSKSQTVLGDLTRGQRLAEANDKAQRVQGQMTTLHSGNLEEAADTLKRLQERQAHSDATVAALEGLSAPDNAAAMSDRLAAAGFGPAKRSDAAAVLARLKNKKS
ncbi:PspA/IM30 family protein [uncultured Sulfitobacter sp.]|uniref:PspA/IM30 family protein n=1 Tax=uncultured Sulfitobacter sp. TaxID=191468 RepID=UPI0026264553|nr:PspA/IM30 family protein [uncultured Sulfitobacter sp.]